MGTLKNWWGLLQRSCNRRAVHVQNARPRSEDHLMRICTQPPHITTYALDQQIFHACFLEQSSVHWVAGAAPHYMAVAQTLVADYLWWHTAVRASQNDGAGLRDVACYVCNYLETPFAPLKGTLAHSQDALEADGQLHFNQVVYSRLFLCDANCPSDMTLIGQHISGSMLCP